MTAFASRINDVWIIDGARTPWVDYCGGLSAISPTDLGIHAARAALARSGVTGADIGSVVVASMAQADFDAYVLPRHVGLYAGVPIETPAIQVQRICGSGLEIFRQAADQIALGYTDSALVVGTESMSRNPICAYTHRQGFKLGAPVEFKDFLWEALDDPGEHREKPFVAASDAVADARGGLVERDRLVDESPQPELEPAEPTDLRPQIGQRRLAQRRAGAKRRSNTNGFTSRMSPALSTTPRAPWASTIMENPSGW